MLLGETNKLATIPGFTDVEQFAQAFVRVDAGTFEAGGAQIGGVDDIGISPLHNVTLTDSYLIGRDPVTNAQLEAFLGDLPSQLEIIRMELRDPYPGAKTRAMLEYYRSGKYPPLERREPAPAAIRYLGLDYGFFHPDVPAGCLSYAQAKYYADWMTTMYEMLADKPFGEGKFRIPTNAQWECGARFRGPGQGWRSDVEAPFATMSGQIPEGRQPSAIPLAVEAAEALPSGIRGMFGNVTEWVADWHGAEYLVGQNYTDPTGPINGEERVLRGGSVSSSVSYMLRLAHTGYHPPNAGSYYGFSVRLVFVPSKHASV